MRLTIATLYYGSDAERYRPLLQQWLAAAQPVSGPEDIVVISDREQPDLAARVLKLSTKGYSLRADQPFDVKGALMCEAIKHISGPLLILDADAIIQRDPSLILASFEHCPIAMPIDLGAVKNPELMPGLRKCCAGVIFFGETGADVRHSLVQGYRAAWSELLPEHTGFASLQKPHLLEQHAWTLTHQRHAGALLPDTMNWPEHQRGPHPEGAFIHHYFGRRKWRTAQPVIV